MGSFAAPLLLSRAARVGARLARQGRPSRRVRRSISETGEALQAIQNVAFHLFLSYDIFVTAKQPQAPVSLLPLHNLPVVLVMMNLEGRHKSSIELACVVLLCTARASLVHN